MRRGTSIEPRLSELFSDAFINEKSDLWLAFLFRINEKTDIASNFDAILVRIIEFIQPVLDTITDNRQLDEAWNPTDGWG